MEKIIELLLEQRNRLVQELCDVNPEDVDWQTKAIMLQAEIANVDVLIQQFKA